MNKEELTRKVRGYYLDEDKEKAVFIQQEIGYYIKELRKDINLKAKYEGLSFYSIGDERYIMIKNRKLIFRLKENKIIIFKSESNEESILDEIIVENRVPKCKHGEFKIEEIDKYITECFSDLL